MNLFGELQLGQSRAVSDDEEEDQTEVLENENLKRKVFWLNQDDEQQKKIKVDEIIIFDGNSSNAFFYTYLLNQSGLADNLKLLGLTTTPSEYNIYLQNNDQHDKHDNSIYRIKNNSICLIDNFNKQSYLVCQLYNQLKSNEIYNWINQVWDRVEFTNCLIFTSQNKISYHGNGKEKFPLVKYISSEIQNSIDERECSRLQEPNFIGNLPAALIHFCVFKSIPFFTFVCYSATLGMDSGSIKEIYKAAKSKNYKGMFVENDLSKKALSAIERMETSVNNLYM